MGWAVVGAVVVTYAIVQSLAPEFLEPAIMVAPIVSAIVAAPVTYVFFRQNIKLAQTNCQLQEANKVLGREVSLDPMTNVLNRSHFVREIEERRNNDERAGFFLMLDADNFKQINDTFGHAVGDAALMRITEVIQLTLRDNDIVGRLGGEEFGIYLRNVNRVQAYEIAERIRERVAKTPLDVGNNQPYNVTVSIGAVFATRQHDVGQLMQLADRNLYRAKDKGRNKVVFDAHIGREGTYSMASQ